MATYFVGQLVLWTEPDKQQICGYIQKITDTVIFVKWDDRENTTSYRTHELEIKHTALSVPNDVDEIPL